MPHNTACHLTVSPNNRRAPSAVCAESPAVTVSPPFHPSFPGPDRGGVYCGCGWGVLSEALTIATVNFVLNLDLPLPPSAVEILRKERAA